ncbi:translation initiation factor eIF3 subunit [Babesia ovis]|uniref:Translation initiation factor eIF3 subunit n=1 Tax=Babesia ovis TaxID=5869 RepID=A0A9W5TET6_BABOV|nr:translation initiation factor eIF3 subunit [Babesia ovis]
MPEDSDTLDCWDAYTDSEDERRFALTGCTKSDAAVQSADVNALSAKLQAQKLSESADRDFVDDLFGVPSRTSANSDDYANDIFAQNPIKTVIPTDPLAHVTLKCLKDCDDVAKKLSQKIDQSSAKSAIWLQFLDTLFQACEKKLDIKDLQTLKRKIEAALKNKEAKQTQAAFTKKKPNDMTSAKNYQDELDMLYGDLSDDDEPLYYQ